MLRYLSHFLLGVRESDVAERVQTGKKENQELNIAFLTSSSIPYRR